MSLRARRFLRLHWLLGFGLFVLVVSLIIVEREINLDLKQVADKVEAQPQNRARSFKESAPINVALELKPIDIVDADVELHVPFHASTFLLRPGAMIPKRALCLRDKETGQERDITENEPIYLQQERGRVTFAPLGEKTALWARAKREKRRVFLDLYIFSGTEEVCLKQVQIPFDGAKPWPKDGICVRGVSINEHLFESLGLKWYGRHALKEKLGERLVFSPSNHVCYAKKGEWFAIRKEGFFPIQVSSFKQEPLIQLKKIEPSYLEFEVIDADAQHALCLRLARTPDSIIASPMKELHFLGLRQLKNVRLSSQKSEFSAPLGSYLNFIDGKWESTEKECISPHIRLEHIGMVDRKRVLYVTLLSPNLSECKKIALPQEL